jgi:hypothetical protein
MAAFIQAKEYRPGRARKVRLIAIHAMQSPEGVNTAEQVAKYFAHIDRPASAHECVDANSWVGCVRDEDTAYAAPGANADGWHIELAGMSEQSAAQWADVYSRQVLALAAKRVALRCRKYGIPARWLTRAQLRDGKSKGLTTHADITKADLAPGDHWDPGPYFPRDMFLQMVKVELDALGGKPWTKARVAKLAAALGVSVSVLGGVTQIPDQPKPVPIPAKPSPSSSTKPPATSSPRPPLKSVTPVKSAPKPVKKPAAKPTRPAAKPTKAPVLTYGSHGAAVWRLHRALGVTGTTPATAYYGRITQRLVRAFQARHHLTTDGVVGPRTAAALKLRLA